MQSLDHGFFDELERFPGGITSGNPGKSAKSVKSRLRFPDGSTKIHREFRRLIRTLDWPKRGFVLLNIFL